MGEINIKSIFFSLVKTPLIQKSLVEHLARHFIHLHYFFCSMIILCTWKWHLGSLSSFLILNPDLNMCQICNKASLLSAMGGQAKSPMHK